MALSGLILCGALLIAAALHDAATRTIPNWMPLGLLLLGIVGRLLTGDAVSGISLGFALFIGLVLLWLRGLIGGGDVKLAAAAAVAVPASMVMVFVLTVAIAGGVLALVYLCLSFIIPRPAPGMRHGILARVSKVEAWRISRRGPIPYAAAITAGWLAVLIPGLPRIL
jgi:prepilin peptidase CpaA